MRPLLLLLVLLQAGPAVSQEPAVSPIILAPGWDMVVIGPHMEFLEDPHRLYTIDDLTSGSLDSLSWFFPEDTSGRNRTDFGFSSSAYWGRFTVRNETALDKEVLLHVLTTNIDSVKVFSPLPEGGYSVEVTGDSLPFAMRLVQFRDPIILLTIPAHTSRTFFTRQVTSWRMISYWVLWDIPSWVQFSVHDYLIIGLVCGGVLLMVFYNLFVFLSVRQKEHLYFVIFAACLGLYTASATGLGFQYLWPNSPGWNQFAVNFFRVCMVFFFILFQRSFLHTRKLTPRVDVFLRILLFLTLGAIIAPFLGARPELVNIIRRWPLVTFALFIPLAYYFQFARKYSPARYLVIGATLQVVVNLIQYVAPHVSREIQSYLFWLKNLAPYLHATFLSLALADKVNQIKYEMRQAQEKALEDLRVTNKLKDDILANTSHELLTPLSGIVGLSAALLTELKNIIKPRQSKALQMIQQSGRRLAGMVGDMLDFSLLQHDRLDLVPSPVDINVLVADVLMVCESMVGQKPLRLGQEIPADLPCVLADEDRLQQILFNLVGNAIKFTEKGEVTVAARQTGDLVTITVRDSGIGVSQEMQEEIFEPFQQEDGTISRRFGGVGLGLAITRRLVDLHGSKLEVESLPGEGAAFSFTLPVTQDADAPTGAPGKAPLMPAMASDLLLGLQADDGEPGESNHLDTSLPGCGRIVLAVDDEPINLKVIEDCLTVAGYQVLAAQDGHLALQLFQEIQPDLVVLDLMMPNMSGYEVCREMRETDDDTSLPVLILTARKAQDNLVQAFDCGANDFLAKPFYPEELVARVGNLIKVRELNEAKQARELLEVKAELSQLSARQLSSLVDAVDLGLVAVDKNLRVTYMNPQALRMFKYEEGDVEGLVLGALFAEATLKQLDIVAERFENMELVGKKFHHDQVSCGRNPLNSFFARVTTTLVQHENDATLALIIAPPVPAASIAAKAHDPRLLAVELMHETVEFWRSSTRKGKTELAQECGLWAVSMDKSTPIPRTLNKYLLLETMPRRPRYGQILKTADFVLAKCQEESDSRERLQSLRKSFSWHLALQAKTRRV